MANKNIKVSAIISKFYDVKEDRDIRGLYAVRPFGKPESEIMWYFFSSNNATYNSYNDIVVIRDIDQDNSGYIDRLISAFKLAKTKNKKIFWLVCVYGDGIGLKSDTNDDISWIASIEVLVKLEELPGSLTLRDFPRGGSGADAWAPCCKRCDQDIHFNTTFISCKDASGLFAKDYMEPYFELYDNRPHHDLITVKGVERIDLKYLLDLDNKKFADAALNLLLDYAKPNDEIFDDMIDSDKSLPITGMHGFPLLKAVPATIRTKDELSVFVKCGTSRAKYYNNIYTINGEKYVFFMNWYSKSKHNPDNRRKFIDWIIDALSRNCVMAYISSEVVTGAKNILLYGVPGAGKSHLIDDEYLIDAYQSVRVVFHPDYTNSTFIGRIMPRVDDYNDKLRYDFIPGPFTEVLKTAIYHPSKKVYLIIEEINRGNAAAIFGELFQLLDRYDDDNPKAGESELGITNYEIAKYIYGDPSVPIKIPSNLWILGTMNTADQNVFTLDTAFQRRWNPRRIPNDVENSKYSQQLIDGSTICWGAFASVVNDIIIKVDQELGGSSDKRLGAYFLRLSELQDREQFAEKVVKYLWDDALKLEQNRLFDKALDSLDEAITECEKKNVDPVKAIIISDIYDVMEKKTKEICK